MNRYEQLKYIFDLDLEDSYTELQYKDFLKNYRTAYREVYAMYEGVKREKDRHAKDVIKLHEELEAKQAMIDNMSQQIFSMRKKMNTKLSFMERLLGKIRF